MKTFNIYGRCVGRDLFEIGKTNEKSPYIIKRYLADINWFEFDEEYFCTNKKSNLTKLGTKEEFIRNSLFREDIPGFLRRMIYLDFTNQSCEYLFGTKSDWLMFDVSMFSTPLYICGQFVMTKSWRFTQYLEVFREKGWVPDVAQCFELNPTDLSREETENKMKKVFDEVLKHYPENRIILLQIKHSNLSLTKSKRIEFYSVNETKYEFEQMCFEIAKRLLPRAHVIEFPEFFRISDENHKWGKHHMHYIDEYYKYALEAVNIITDGRSTEKQDLDQLVNAYSYKISNKYRGVYLKKLQDNERQLKALKLTANKYRSFITKETNDIKVKKYLLSRNISKIGIVAAGNETVNYIRPILKELGIAIIFELKSGTSYEGEKTVDAIFNASVLIKNEIFQKYFDVSIFNLDDVWNSN